MSLSTTYHIFHMILKYRFLSSCRLVSAVAQRFGGLLFGLLEMTLVKFYQYVVDPAPPGSWPVRLFARLAQGPLKCGPVAASGCVLLLACVYVNAWGCVCDEVREEVVSVLSLPSMHERA